MPMPSLNRASPRVCHAMPMRLVPFDVCAFQLAHLRTFSILAWHRRSSRAQSVQPRATGSPLRTWPATNDLIM